MMPSVDHPWLLLLLAVCWPALLGTGLRWLPYASLTAIPADTLSACLDWTLRAISALALVALVLGLAGLHDGPLTVERHGLGAHVVLVLDRSLSMDEPFALRGEKSGESKAQAASRMLAAFFARRPHDRFGVIAFSTSPIPAMPLTEHREAVAASIRAMAEKGLANTDIGAGLAMGLAQFDRDPPGAAPGVARVLVLVSDGAGAIAEPVRDYIRAAAQRSGAHIYYLYLRSGDDPPLVEEADESRNLGRPAGLDSFFRTLGRILRRLRGARRRCNRSRNEPHCGTRDAPNHLFRDAAKTRSGRRLLQRGRTLPGCRPVGPACRTANSSPATYRYPAGASMKRVPRRLKIWLGITALLAGAALVISGGAQHWQMLRQNSGVSALAVGHDLAVTRDAPILLQLAKARYLITQGQFDGAQAIADRMAGEDASPERAELLYALGNAHMRQALRLFKTMPFRKVAPILSLAKAEYRQVIQLDPDDWDARYNYTLAAALVRDTEAAQPTASDLMAHERATWPDIPGAPNGMP